MNINNNFFFKTYFETNYVPPVVHCLNTEIVMRAPKDQPISFLPQMWQSYLEYVSVL